MLLAVVNGAAGAGRGAKIWRTAAAELVRRSIPFEAIIEPAGHLALSAVRARIKAGADGRLPAIRAMAVIGGDGTLHAVLPASVEAGIPLGMIPAGSGNDTVRAFHLPGRPLDALERILAGRTRSVDLIELRAFSNEDAAEPAYSLTALACGFDASVAEAVNRAGYKRWCSRLGLGSLAYVIGVLDKLRTYRPMPVTVRIDGIEHTFETCWMAAVTNTSNYGGGLRICPDADPADGMLDVCIVHSCTPGRLLRLFPTLLNGTHVRLPYVTLLRGNHIELRPASGHLLPVVGDGEPLAAAPLSARADRHRLRLFI